MFCVLCRDDDSQTSYRHFHKNIRYITVLVWYHFMQSAFFNCSCYSFFILANSVCLCVYSSVTEPRALWWMTFFFTVHCSPTLAARELWNGSDHVGLMPLYLPVALVNVDLGEAFVPSRCPRDHDRLFMNGRIPERHANEAGRGRLAAALHTAALPYCGTGSSLDRMRWCDGEIAWEERWCQKKGGWSGLPH